LGWYARLALIVLWSAGGCRGETVSSPAADAARDDVAAIDGSVDAATSETAAADTSSPTDALAMDAGCEPRPGNLLRDPSFEDLIPVDGGYASSDWHGVPLTRDPMAAHCSYAATFTEQGGEGPAQYRALPTALPVGGRIRVRAKARWVAGAKTTPGLFLYLIQGSVSGGTYFNRSTEFATWTGDGAWHEHSYTFTNDTGADVTSFGFVIFTNATTPQTLAIDDAEVTLVGDGG